MRSLRLVIIGVAVLGVLFFLSRASFAQGDKEAKIKVLQDSAAALAQSNPDLSKGLTDLANEETNEKTEGKKTPVAKDSPEWKAKHDARVKLFQDSAAALQAAHPDLASSLLKMAERKHKKITQPTAGLVAPAPAAGK
jgi:hypothetical protein